MVPGVTLQYDLIITIISVAINLLMMIGGAVVTWFLKGLQSSLARLRQENEALRTQLQGLHVIVLGKHVTRDELDMRLEKLNDAIFRKLDRIEEKLDRKEDRVQRGFEPG